MRCTRLHPARMRTTTTARRTTACRMRTTTTACRTTACRRGAHRAIQPLFSRPVGLEKPFTAKQRDLSFGHTPQCHWLTVRYLASRFRFISFPLSHLLSTSPFSKRLASGMTFPTYIYIYILFLLNFSVFVLRHFHMRFAKSRMVVRFFSDFWNTYRNFI